jgi:hypothetical protein
MRPGWKWVAAMSVLVLGIVVSVSGAATSGNKRDGGDTSDTRSEKRLGVHVGAPGEHLSTLADELGVTEDKLRDALEAVRRDITPRKLPFRERPPSRAQMEAQMEKHCKEFTDALAKELDKSGDDVRAAMKSAAKKGIEEAVDDGDLTRKQADQILSRIDDSACAPKFGFHIRGGHGCGGPGGPDGPGERGRFERPAPPPGPESEGSSTVAPVPLLKVPG